MKPTLRQIEEREKQKKEKRQIDTLIKYDRAKICPKCGELMRYAFGEVFKCDNCGAEELTSFGKVRKYIEDHGLLMQLIYQMEQGFLYQQLTDICEKEE